MSTETILQKLNDIETKVNILLKSQKSKYNDREWIDKQETMEILKCSERTLQTLRDKGTLAFSNPLGGSKFFYKLDDVIALFKKNFSVKNSSAELED
jgi:hypothetical protein